MTWPTSDVNTSNLGSSTNSPSAARPDLYDLAVKFNLLKNHVPIFGQNLMDDADAAAARATLKIGSDWFRATDSASRSTAGTFATFAYGGGTGFTNATGVYVVPTTGKYLINFSTYYVATASLENNYSGLQVNGADPNGHPTHINICTHSTATSGAIIQGSRSTVLSLTAGDLLTMKWVGGTAALSVFCAEFSGVRLS